MADYEILYNIKMRRGRFIGDMYNAVGLLAKRKHSLRTVIEHSVARRFAEP